MIPFDFQNCYGKRRATIFRLEPRRFSAVQHKEMKVALDRARRIGQKKEIQDFRFCTEYTIDEKVIERAYKKLALDVLVIQQGRLAEAKTVNKDELLQMKIISDNWIEPPKRERKLNYSESEYFKQTMRQSAPFFNTHRLSELYEKEVRYIMQAHQRKQVKDTIEVDEPESMIIKSIERGEARISWKDEIMKDIGNKLDRY
ncbi:hypothetical protein ACS0TY_033941 [Phlomoides rotata]